MGSRRLLCAGSVFTLCDIAVRPLGRVGEIYIITFGKSVQHVFPYLLGALAPVAGLTDMTHSQEYAACLDGGEDPWSQVDRDYQEIPRILLHFAFRGLG